VKPVVVTGDLICDEWVEGRVDRISPEGPVPVLLEDRPRRTSAGGAGFVARCVGALGGRPLVVGVVGGDVCGAELVNEIGDFVAVDYKRVTPTKTRFTSGGHPVLRVDREQTDWLSEADEIWAVDVLRNVIPGAAAVVVSDYAKGTITPLVAQTVAREAALAGVPVVVDTKPSRFRLYKRATVMKPNDREMREICPGLPGGVDGLITGAQFLVSEGVAGSVVVTMGEDGALVYPSGGQPFVTASPRVPVSDVTGAGDVFAAALGVCLGAGRPLSEAARYACAASAESVRYHGTHAPSRTQTWALGTLSPEVVDKLA